MITERRNIMSEKNLKYGGVITIILIMLALAGCATTRLKGAWVNPEYQGKRFNKILVLGIAENETYLRLLEKNLSVKLSNRGLAAEPGYQLFETGKRPSREEITRIIADQGFDALIISKVAGRRTEEVVHPGGFYYVREPFYAHPFYGWRRPYPPRFFGHHWYDYYSRSYTLMHEPGYVTQYEVMTVESNVYDARTDELIWSGITDTVVQGNIENMINSLVNTLVRELAAKNLI